MEIKVNIEKKHFWILTLLILGIGLVIAYGTNNPEVFGHSAEEIDVTFDGATTSLQDAIDTLSQGPSGAGGSQVIASTYTGDGTADRFIAVPGISAQPSLVWVVQNTGHGPPLYRIASQNLHADLRGNDDNFKWTNIAPSNAGDNLRGVEQGGGYGFMVSNANLGNGFTTNTLNYQYSYFVIVPYNAPSVLGP